MYALFFTSISSNDSAKIIKIDWDLTEVTVKLVPPFMYHSQSVVFFYILNK